MPSSSSSFSLYNIQLNQLVINSLILLLFTKVEEIYAFSEVHGGMCDYGANQSPINIDTSELNLLPRTQPFVFVNYNITSLVLLSNPKTIVAAPSSTYLIDAGVAAGGLRGFFKLFHIHFHWDSEHTINRKRYPVEVHFVHYNTIYNDLDEAIKFPGGVAVISVLFTKGEKSKAIDEIIQGIERISRTNVEKLDLELKPRELLPPDEARFYRYYGSLTTPPCSENVIWTVFERRKEMSQAQIDWFHKFPAIYKLPESNNRLVQDGSGRKIELWIGSYKNKALINCKTNNELVLLLLLFLYLQNFLV